MRSDYYLIWNEGATSYLKRKMTSTVFHGNMQMMRSYNRHGREQGKIAQVTCDAEVEEEFLAAMRKERIPKLPASYDPLNLTEDHPARGEERRWIETDHGNWYWCSGEEPRERQACDQPETT